MNFWTYLHLFTLIVYSFAVFYVIIKNPYAVTNWVLAALFGCFVIWSGCSVVLNNTNMDIAKAGTIFKIQSIGWASFISLYFLFIVFLTNNKKILSMPLFYVILFLLPVVFIYQNYNGEMLQSFRKVSYGIAGTWKNSIWSYAYFSFYIVLFISATYMLFKHRNSIRIKSEKKIADILLISAMVVFTTGTITCVILNYLGIYIPLDVNIIFLIFVFGFIYSAEKYETFSLTSIRNADRIMEMINEGIIILERDGNITTANRAAMEIFGYPAGNETKDIYFFIEEQIKNAGISAGGSETINIEFNFKDAAGILKTALISSRVLKSGDDNSGRLCTIRDITEKKKAEVDLIETVKELKRSNEELESFAYVASHDLKEPLRMVTSYVQLIRKKFIDQLGKDGNDFINFASDGAKRMSELIDGLLEYSRIRRIGREAVFVDTLLVVFHVLDIMKFKIQEKKAVVSVQGLLPAISADKMQIEQLFQNILSNALKFTGKEQPVITISAEKVQNYYKFIIKDNGIGMEKQYQDRVFQLFQRLHSRDKYEGTGVGLAICKKIVEAHGGRMWMDSDGPDKGCSFIFTISLIHGKELTAEN